MHNDGEAEIRRQALRDRPPCIAVVVAPEHPDVGSRSAWAGPLRPAAMILHVEATRRRVVARDFVHALPEFRIRIRIETGADAGVGGIEGLAAVLAQVMSASRNAEMHA